MAEKIRVEIDPDLEDLIPGFLENRAKDIRAIRALVAAGDMERIRIIGHSMKGVGGGYGFDEITHLGARIEKAACAANSNGVIEAVAELEDYLSRVEVVRGTG
jgi:HPt (histidine-containing phosphotransfer) domain-containing protein